MDTVHHRMCHFHAGAETIDQDAAGDPFQRGQQFVRCIMVGRVEMQRCRELAFERFDHAQQLRQVAAAHHQ